MRTPRKQDLDPGARPSTNQPRSQTRHHDNSVSPLPCLSHRTFPSSQNTLTSSTSSSLPFSTLFSTSLRIIVLVGDGDVDQTTPTLDFDTLLYLSTRSSPRTSPQTPFTLQPFPSILTLPAFYLSLSLRPPSTQTSTTKTLFSTHSPFSRPSPLPLTSPQPSVPLHIGKAQFT